MRYWLFKSEPFKWSFDMQKGKGETGQEWDGVRNYQARNFMREMAIGDRGFFYHSNEGKEVVGIVEVVATAHPDSTADGDKWECVDVKALMDVPQPVSLDAIKAEPRLRDMVLVNNSRLSVQPVTAQEFAIVCEMGELDAKKAMGR